MFEQGKEYNRRLLHEEYGGQRQGGISTPTGSPVILVFTGDSGEKYGYRDSFQADGTFWYTGEGRRGDMTMVRGNAAIRDHLAQGKTLYLFEHVRRGVVRYVGEASCLGHHCEDRPDEVGELRKAIIFELSMEAPDDSKSKSTEGASPDDHSESSLYRMPLAELRRRAVTRQM